MIIHNFSELSEWERKNKHLIIKWEHDFEIGTITFFLSTKETVIFYDKNI